VGAIVGVGEGVGWADGLGVAEQPTSAMVKSAPSSRGTWQRAQSMAAHDSRSDRWYAQSVESREIEVTTGHRRGVFDLTAACRGFVREVSQGGDGLLHVFAPHATAGLVIMELGSGSDADLVDVLDSLLPRDDRWRHQHGSAGHGADHVLPLLVAPFVTVPVLEGELALGTWQSIALLDPNADNARRRVRVSYASG
jgi:secondary thiamine-phosphate synthase enzyme